MEIKNLVDQLNSACDEYFNIPQTNGFPIQDELIQENCLEPEFLVLRRQDGAYCYSHFENREKDNCQVIRRTDCIKKRLVEVCKDKNRFKVTAYKNPENLEYTDRTIFYFQEPENEEGRRWTIRICNCYDSDLAKNKDDSKDGLCAEGEQDCAKFQITWKKNLKKPNISRGGLNAVVT
eukprot:GHVP01052557.1.p1 GENE.GHVP01052557.1~~GHVP01052557.1.p1  ORF type:complete len:178 (-),score=16.29 GHVP01052557.1:164-697(-)